MDESRILDIIKEESGKAVAEYAKESEAKAAEAKAEVVRYEAPLNEPTKAEKTQQAGAFLRSMAAAKGDGEKASRILKSWGHDAVAKALDTGAVATGGALVPEILSQEVVEYLHAGSAFLSLSPRQIPLPQGNLTLGKFASSATAQYTAENAEIAKSEPSFEEVKLEAKKLTCLVPVSNELLNDSSPAADQLVIDDARMAFGARQDLAMIVGAGGSEPTGIDSQVDVANAFDVTKAAAAATAEEIVRDLGRAMQVLSEADVQVAKGGWLMSPRTKYALWLLRDNGYYVFKDQMDNGMLLGHPFAETSQIVNNRDDSGDATNDESRVYFADFSRLLYGETGGLRVDVSTEATYDFAGTAVSAFASDQTVVRLIGRHDMKARHLGKEIAVIKAVDWA